MTRQHGFTLMELLVVVALILILAAIAVPGMTYMKIHADEASAVSSIRAINEAEVSYEATYGGYAASLANLGGGETCTKSPETACLLDESLSGGVHSGYHFAAVGNDPANGVSTGYVVGAAPIVYERTGKRLFCSTDRNVIRVDLNNSGSTTPPDREQCALFKALQ